MTRIGHDTGLLTLVQAIELEDAGMAVLGADDRARATREALGQARAEQAPADLLFTRVLYLRAAVLLDVVHRKAPALGVIARRWSLMRRLLVLLPLAAFVVGFASDHITDPHRLDLLSPPLLLVLLWNCAVYLYLAVGTVLPGRAAPALPRLLVDIWDWLMGRRGGLRIRVAARFASLWASLEGHVFVARCAAAMHLAAAAWAAGIGMSLALRGVFVRYAAGWESTYLDAGQVHGVLRLLFWPLTAIFGLEPFPLPEIAAMENFGSAGQGGRHWVLLYGGLLVLVVIVPRGVLAALAFWRARSLHGSIVLDLQQPYFQALAAQLPRQVEVGLLAADAWQWQAMARTWAPAPDGSLQLDSAQGDRLVFVPPAGAAGPVDLVLDISGERGSVVPAPWNGASRVTAPWDSFGASWVTEPQLFAALIAGGPPACRPALERLRDAAALRNSVRFDTACDRLGEHLRDCVVAIDRQDFDTFYAASRTALHQRLAELHGWPVTLAGIHAASAGDAAERGAPALWRSPSAVTAAGAGAGAAAGALAGAKFGAALDIATGGATLGAGTMAGALGGAMAWVMQAWRRKGQNDEAARRVAEDALAHYLAIAHLGRDADAHVDAGSVGDVGAPVDSATTQPLRGWRSEAVAELAVRWASFESALHTPPPAAGRDPLAVAFQAAASHIMAREFGGEAATAPATPA